MKLLTCFLFVSVILFSQERILIDEDFSDWENVSAKYSDPPNDGAGGSANIDFKDFWVSNDDEYLYFRIQTGDEITLVNSAFDNHYLTLFVDTDNNSNTGRSVNGIGAELEYQFPDRDGKTYFNNGEQDIEHNDIGFLGAPTYSAKQFEFAIKRNVMIEGNQLFPSETIKIVFAAYDNWQQFNLYDSSPDDDGYAYTFIEAENVAPPAYSIQKTDIGYLRVMAYNIEQDGILDQSKTTEFNHIFTAVSPDLIGFTEVYDGSSQQVADRVEFFLPSDTEEQWYHQKNDWDIVLVSRFSIKDFANIYYDNQTATGAFLLDLRPKYNSDMLVIVSHPKCCSGTYEDEKRQHQIDSIMEFLRNAEDGTGSFIITKDIPIVILGDMNLVGDSRQYETLISGDIYNNGKYGEDFTPDWDETGLDDAIPFVTNTGFTYTTNSGGYPPGRLDFIFYSGSVMELVNSYNLDAGRLTSDELTQFGLNASDTKVSDHLPVVADFDLSPIAGIKKKDDTPKNFGLKQNYPNPFNPATTIKFAIPLETQSAVSLQIFNPLGQQVETLVNKNLTPGNYEVLFNAEELTSGIYYYKLTAGDFVDTKKMILLK